MSDQPMQGGEVFEITDHTTATDWERFIANLEEILADWQLDKQSDKPPLEASVDNSISSGIWHERHDELRFGNVHFDLRYQYLSNQKTMNLLESDTTPEARPVVDDSGTDSSLIDVPKEKEKEHGEHDPPDKLPDCLRDMMNHKFDYASKAHCLVRWYNLRRFILLIPRGDTILTEDRVKLILSSASIALSNMDCHLPLYIQVHTPKSSFFQGISEHYNIRTMYEMVFYKQSVARYRYLSELVSLFREKLSHRLADPLTVTIRLNYCLDSFQFLTTSSLDNPSSASIEKASSTSQRVRPTLMSGVTFDQVVEELKYLVPLNRQIIRFIHVAALWLPISDKIITDSQVHSDLDPAEAPLWTIRCVAYETGPMKVAYETHAIHNLFCNLVDYAYNNMDAESNFTDCDKTQLKDQCLKLSYDLATKPEVVLSDQPSDPLRKLMALMFYRAAESDRERDGLEEIANHLKKKPSLNEVYRNFNRENKASVKEFILRTSISRPFAPITTPALPQRMFATLCDNEFRVCGAFSELTN